MSQLLPIVLAAPSGQLEKARRLADYWRHLDGTILRIFRVPEDNDEKVRNTCPYPHNIFNNLQLSSLHLVAESMKGEPFIWAESDSVPVRAGAVKAISTEYRECGRPFLLSSDSNPPDDLVGGIGVYGPQTSWIIPKSIHAHGWDRWMVENIPDLIHRTPLIQHSYGEYDSAGSASPHIFPRDNTILRTDAYIFHRDKYQSLIPGAPNHPNEALRFFHSGDLGDIIACLPSMRQLGGGHLVLGLNDRVRTREPMTEKRYANIAPLLRQQPYLVSVSYGNQQDGYDVDFSKFRDWPIRKGESLVDWQARYAGIKDVDQSPWLTVEESLKFQAFRNRPIFARSSRYQNPIFPWFQMLKKMPDAVFIGTREEHAAFSRRYRIAHAQTENLLEVAQIIQGGRTFVGNQSCPCWIAMGLGKPVIQETFAKEANSIVRRPNSQFVINGLRHISV